MRILNFGSLNIDNVYRVDHINAPGETQTAAERHVNPGGKGLNQSIALARAGAEVWHAGRIGADGIWLRDLLGKNGVHTDFVEETDDSTGHAIIQVDSSGQNSIVLYAGANRRIDEAMVDAVLTHFAAGDILLLQNEISCIPYIVDRAYDKGLRIVLNPSPFDGRLAPVRMDKIALFLLNEIEGFQMTGETEPERILDRMAVLYPAAEVVLTLGEKGAVRQKAGERVYREAYRVKAVDTTAAGDTFTGYYLAMRAQGKTAEEALDIASRAASIAVTRQGAAASIPTKEEVIAS